jgi:hypothetical protein
MVRNIYFFTLPSAFLEGRVWGTDGVKVLDGFSADKQLVEDSGFL